MTTAPALSTASKTALHLVGFTVGNEEFCFDIRKVLEVIRMVPITAVPSAPADVEGIINLRGRIIPIIDFRRRFTIADERSTDDAEKVIVVAAAKGSTVGFIVDGVSQVLKLPPDLLSPPPTGASGRDAEAVRGVGIVGDRLLIVLDLEKMFSDDEMTGLAGTASSQCGAYF